MQGADVTIQAAVERRLAFVDALTWQIRTSESADPALADEQAAALRQAYNGIDNLRDASRALALSAFTGYALLDKVPADGLFPTRLDDIPPWFWVRPRGRPWEPSRPSVLRSHACDGFATDSRHIASPPGT
jgi:hypothetical protein